MAENMQDDSAAARVFKTPEILQSIMGHLSIEDFVRAQAGHRHFLDVALLYPILRHQFFLEVDSRSREKPVINPLSLNGHVASRYRYRARYSGSDPTLREKVDAIFAAQRIKL
ncbi:hypothetical protein Slin14017_G113190 [Septoria linicola]|nr:hypothetical protein Slin14017_G113190 [Septoria linicola]